jgi:2TM domain
MGTLDKASEAEVGTATSTVSERERARTRVQTRRDFASHVVAYIVINAFLVGIWAFTGAGYFWPAWVLGAWGAGLVLHAWDAFVRRPITEADIDAEIQRYHH